MDEPSRPTNGHRETLVSLRDFMESRLGAQAESFRSFVEAHDDIHTAESKARDKAEALVTEALEKAASVVDQRFARTRDEHDIWGKRLDVLERAQLARGSEEYATRGLFSNGRNLVLLIVAIIGASIAVIEFFEHL